MKKYIGWLLIILGITMIYLSYKISGLPPAITGVGFIAIAIVFLRDKN